MKATGYRVVLIISADFTDAEAVAELRRISFALHWTKAAYWRKSPLRTRLGRRFPFLRRLLWESIKPLLRELRGNARAEVTSPIEEPGNSDHVHGFFVSDKLLKTVGKLARRYKPHAVIVEYVFATPLFASFAQDTLKIVDTIDVFSLKKDQVLAFGITTDFLTCSPEAERRYLLMADTAVAIQLREAELLREIVPERNVILAGVDFDVVDDSFANGAIPFRIAVVASDNPLNVHGLRGFLEECWPAIKRSCPAVSLHVVGRVGDLCRIEDASIQYSNWVADLTPVYREASVVINPAIAGTGLKIKSVEALAHGKPLVAWPHGVDGLEYEGTAPFIECRSWREFGDAIIRLLISDAERNALSNRALAYARAEFEASAVYTNLRKHLGEPQRS